MAANDANNDNPTGNSQSLRAILQRERLNHTNFMDWYRNLRIVLKQEKRSYILDDPIPDEPNEDDEDAYLEWVKYVEDSVQVSCLMLASMTTELQKEYELHGAYDMITQLSNSSNLHGDRERMDEAEEAEGFPSDMQKSTAKGERQDIRRREKTFKEREMFVCKEVLNLVLGTHSLLYLCGQPPCKPHPNSRI
ncbi:hypothetical protein E3N88_07340 [Mikania micrantha]|uniref:Uncharacterized protein n=1 Tax=Mikania micrantha TaxID=192012 RepID=A0A5N6PRA5_9ASTR|nr:hypothetical protein E3N88_07340 [Mikania micrantha]